MRVFVSWSGDRSKKLASALADWLPRVLPLVGTSMSESIPAGTEWRTVLMERLKKCDAVIACLTPENVRSQWLNFEAGAAAGMLDYRLFPIFLGNDPLPPGPLSGLQVMRFTENDLRHLVHRLNAQCEPNCRDAWVSDQFTLLWKKLATRIELADRSWVDYRDAINSIREHLGELERLMQVNVITFYVRDYAAPDDLIDFYLEATHGLRDPAPMYGPVVAGDYRPGKWTVPDEFDGDMTETMRQAAVDKVADRARTFIGREKILAKATFWCPDTDGGVKGSLHLNWRSKQEFSSERKDELREHAAAVFRLLPQQPSISLERARLLTKELRARRHLDIKSDKSLGDTIRDAIGQFFEGDPTALTVQLWAPGETDHAIAPDWKWVYETTKPLFLEEEEETSIIVPMRIAPGRKTCKGIIAISERGDRRNQLKSQMVRPLCSLADTFGDMPGGLQ